MTGDLYTNDAVGNQVFAKKALRKGNVGRFSDYPVYQESGI